jgi:hypothetical protein
MRRYTLLYVILACVAVAALLTWMAFSYARFHARPSRVEIVAAAGKDAVTQALPPFTRIEVSGAAEVVLVQGAADAVALPANLPRKAHLDATVSDGTLHLRAGDGTRWWDSLLGGGPRTAPVVVTFRDLEAITASGTVRLSAGTIKVNALRITGAGGTQVAIDDLTTGSLRVAGSGALKAELAGRADTQNVTISGAGEYRGGKLVSQDATVTVSGAGQVVVNAQKTLNVTLSGAGIVEYLGDPAVTKRVSGAGSVRRREARGGGVATLVVAQ